MAVVKIPSDNVTLTDAQDVTTFLAVRGIEYERWTPSRDVPADAPAEAVLEAYAHQIEALKLRGGYVTADVIDVNADTPNLDVMLAKFNKEHWHDEDEVRFIIEGRGLFHINAGDSVFVLEVGRGDLIRVPRGTHHWFDLCAERAHPRHPSVPESLGLDAALHRERRRPRISAAVLRSLVRRAFRAAALVRSDRVLQPARRGIDVVLLDIEGTTTPIAFVHDVLFPYARARVSSYLEENATSDPEIRRIVEDLRLELPASGFQLAADDPASVAGNSPRAATSEPRDADIVAYVHWLMDRDRKSGPLKALQGRIWEQGYATGALQGEVYPDVRDAFVRWTAAGVRIAHLLVGQRARAETAVRELDGW